MSPMMKIRGNIDCWEAVLLPVERKETIKGVAVTKHLPAFTHLEG